MRGLIRSLAGDGITVLVSSHLISEIEQICDYVVMIRAGRLVHQGPVTELRATQQAEFVIAPEHDADLEVLSKLIQQAGGTVTEGNGSETEQLRQTLARQAARLVAGRGLREYYDPVDGSRPSTASRCGSWASAPRASSGRSSR